MTEAAPEPSLSPAAASPGAVRFATVAVGVEHGCASDRAGALYCWGEGSRFGAADRIYDQPVRIDAVSGVVAVAVGTRTMVVSAKGELTCLGCRSDGAPRRIAGLAPVRAVGTALTFACALERAGSVKCWSWWYDHYAAPQPIVWPALAGATAFAVSDGAVCAIVGGRVVCQDKSKATGHAGNPTVVEDSQPGLRTAPLGDRMGFDVVTGSPDAGCASGSGKTACWDHGEFASEFPLRVSELAGTSARCAVSEDGVRCFDTIEPPDARPLIAGAIHVAVGIWETCAVTARGDLLCWRRHDREGCAPETPCRLDVR